MWRRGLQLLGARHRQHGDDLVRYATPEKQAVAAAAAGRADPLGLRHDRARGVVSSDATNIEARIERGRRIRDQRPQVVDIGRDGPRCKILIFMGRPTPTTRAATASSR